MPFVLTGRRAIVALAGTQILGWGSTYFLPSMLGAHMAADLDMPVSLVFAGVTIMLIVSALTSPALGRWTDRNGPHRLLLLGPVLIAAGLAVLAVSWDIAGYVVGWTIFGLAMPMALTPAPFVAAASMLPGASRRAVGLMMLLGGGTTAIFLPLMAWLEPLAGWRAVCWLFAALQLAVALPLHRAIRLPASERGSAEPGTAPAGSAGIVDPAARRRAFWAMAVAFSCIGFVTWGLPLHLVDIAVAYGLPPALAVAVGAVLGPSQMAARLIETLFGQRLPLLAVGVWSLWLVAAACALPLVFGGSFAMLMTTVVAFGLGAGINTIVRLVAPLTVFGRAGYAGVMGRLALPMNLVFATAPFALAAAHEAGGPDAPMALCMAVGLVALAALFALKRIAEANRIQ